MTGGRLAQPVRAPASHAGGQRFESSIAHHLVWLTELIELDFAEVAEWQTRYVQDVVSERVCGFKSLLRHHLSQTT